MNNAIERERGVVVVELEPEDFLCMRIDSAVLEAPHKAHYVGENIELVDDYECESHGREDHYDANVHKCCEPARLAVDEVADEEGPKNLTEAKKDHGEHGPLELVLIVTHD